MDLVVSERGDGVVVIDVGGSVDVYTASDLRNGLDTQIHQGRTRLVIDLRDVDFLDSTGLGVLVARLKLVRSQDGWLRLVCADDKILRVFRITGLDKVFHIHDSVEDALETVGRPEGAAPA